MRRREFIAMVGASVASWLPRPAAAQQRPFFVAVLVGNRDSASYLEMLQGEMERLGYAPDRNLRMEFRSGASTDGSLPPIAQELAALKPDVIVAWLTPAVQAVQKATGQIPIVMGGAGDPVATGLVASLARPGGNTTGLAGATSQLTAKNVELVRELLPNAKRLSVLGNAKDTYTDTFLTQVEAAAGQQRLACSRIMIESEGQLDAAFKRMSADGTDAVLVQPSLPVKRAASLALEARLPSASPIQSFAREGGLVCYSGRISEQFRLVAQYVDKILKGAKPADLPVQIPTQFDLRLNVRTAKAIGVAIPPTLLLRADEVIE
ncbi:MAG: ABC transporter substrate-binding protein [Bradyrhizobium sp.]|nr:ABC transporter substrate-binding protein [Bradyrhizobium sp.]